ncbi:MAG: rRNA maturation RNase YbeY [bacterium]
MDILVFFDAKLPGVIKKKTGLFKKAVLAGLGKFAKKEGETSLIFVGNSEIKKINKTFLKKDTVTDVIAFNYTPPICRRFTLSPIRPFAGSPSLPFGDIYVCADRAEKQAKQMRHSLLKELLILSVHGALHLSGQEDDTAKKRLAMRCQTDKILRFIRSSTL